MIQLVDDGRDELADRLGDPPLLRIRSDPFDLVVVRLDLLCPGEQGSVEPAEMAPVSGDGEHDVTRFRDLFDRQGGYYGGRRYRVSEVNK